MPEQNRKRRGPIYWLIGQDRWFWIASVLTALLALRVVAELLPPLIRMGPRGPANRKPKQEGNRPDARRTPSVLDASHEQA